MTIERKRATVPFQRKSVSAAGEFVGLASTFGNVDFGGDIVVAGAFRDTLSEWKARGEFPLLAWYHDMGEPVGDWLEMSEDSIGLPCRGQLWVDSDRRTEAAVKARNMLTGTGPKGLSIGYGVRESEEAVRDGKSVRLLKNVELYEVSIVPFGMNPKALVSDAKASNLFESGTLVDIRTAEALVRDVLGLSAKQAKAFLADGYKGLRRDGSEHDNALTGIAELISSLEKIK